MFMKESHLNPPDLTEFAALGFTGNEVHIRTFFITEGPDQLRE